MPHDPHNDREPADPTGAARMTRWLGEGRPFFTPAGFERLREVVAEILASDRAAALRQAQQIDETLLALQREGPLLPLLPELSTGSATLSAPSEPTFHRVVVNVARKDLAPSAVSSVRAAVRSVVTEHPGRTAPEIIELVRLTVPGADDGTIFTSLTKLSRPGGALRKEGSRGHYTYFAAEEDLCADGRGSGDETRGEPV